MVVLNLHVSMISNDEPLFIYLLIICKPFKFLFIIYLFADLGIKFRALGIMDKCSTDEISSSAVSNPFLEKCLFKSFTHFKKSDSIFLLLRCQVSYVFWILTPSNLSVFSLCLLPLL